MCAFRRASVSVDLQYPYPHTADGVTFDMYNSSVCEEVRRKDSFIADSVKLRNYLSSKPCGLIIVVKTSRILAIIYALVKCFLLFEPV